MTKDKIIDFLKSVDGDFAHRLSDSINFEEFSQKAIYVAHTESEIDEDGHIKGLVVGYANNKETGIAYISFVAVTSKFRKQGIARRLMLRFVDYAGSIPFIKHVGIHTYNPIAMHLYKEIGFVEKSVSKGCYYLEYSINNNDM